MELSFPITLAQLIEEVRKAYGSHAAKLVGDLARFRGYQYYELLPISTARSLVVGAGLPAEDLSFDSTN